MQNVDPLLFVQPVLAIAMSVGVTVFWWNAKGFRGIALALSAAAYAAAIASKYVIQALTLGLAVAVFGPPPSGSGCTTGCRLSSSKSALLTCSPSTGQSEGT